MGVHNAFLRNCLLPPASLSFRGILMGFLTKTRLFRDKGCYRLASHDDFDGRRQHWLEVKSEEAFNSLLQPRRESKCQGSDVEDTNWREWKSLMGDAGRLDLRRRRRVRTLRLQNATMNYYLLRTAFHCGGISRSLAYVSEPCWIAAQNRLVSAHPFKIRSLRLKPQSGRVLITPSLGSILKGPAAPISHSKNSFFGISP